MPNQEYTTSRLIIIYRKGSEDFVYGGGEGRDLMGFQGKQEEDQSGTPSIPPPPFSGDEMNNDRSLTLSLPRSP